METVAPPEAVRQRIASAVGLSILLPGAGHARAGHWGWALLCAALCQGLLFGGMALAGGSQLDFGTWLRPGGVRLLFLVLPEVGNFLGTQVAAAVLHSREMGGRAPDWIPLRNVGYLMSGASGVLSAFAASHAAGLVLARSVPSSRKVQPGAAALASLLLPGLGHWLTGRRFKAFLFGGTILGLFFLGMALGGFADFDRQRHPYYWAGQMMLGPVGWITAWLAEPVLARAVLPYQDAGLLFTTSAGLFAIVAALDSYQRAEGDWLRVPSAPEASAAP